MKEPGANPEPRDTVTGDVSETNLETAVRSWLPEALPKSDRPDMHAVRSLQALSDTLLRRHDDPWLADLLRAPKSTALSRAIERLSRSATLNSEDKPSPALRQAREAEYWFERAGVREGIARAGVEELYALQRAQRGNDCLARAAALAPASDGRYGWIEAQTQMERSICRFMTGDLGGALVAVKQAAQTADHSHYDALRLRVDGIWATISSQLGDKRAAWSEDVAGLRRFWQREYPARRAHQFYNDMSRLASADSQWHTAVAAKREAVRVAAGIEDHAMEAMGRYVLGTLAISAGGLAEAREELARAEKLFSDLPRSPENAAFRLYSELGLSEAEGRNGDALQARKRLDRIRPFAESGANELVGLRYYQASADLHLRQGETLAAERELEVARKSASQSRNSLKDERSKEIWSRTNDGIYRSSVELLLRHRRDPLKAWQVWREYRGTLDMQHFEDATLLSYTQFQDGLALWTVRQGKLDALWLAASSASTSLLLEAFRDLCGNPNSRENDVHKYGALLYRTLLSPIEARVPAGELIFVEPDNQLMGIPWEALTDAHGAYAADRYRFAVLAAAGGRSSGTRSDVRLSSTTRALVIGGAVVSPVGGREMMPLPEAVREVRTVAATFLSSNVLLGGDVTMTNIQRLLPQAGLLHIAGHGGSLGGGEILLSGGVDSPSVLDAMSLSKMNAGSCQLAVLSACATLGEFSKNSWASDSLVRAFHRLGVPWVVASRWNVDSAATAGFMQSFYKRLIEGGAVPNALAAAGATTRGQNSTSHPYYWAAFGAYFEP